MGSKWVHRLVEVNGDDGVCTNCGPVGISYRMRGARRQARCVIAVKAQRVSHNRQRRPHGLTPPQAREFLSNKVCAICGGTENLVVDHCHKTGVIRDALCSACNAGIGLLRDRPDLMRTAALYVENHAARHQA